MDFSTRGPQPQKHALGITMVIALHAIVIYALVTGLGKKIVDVIKQPIETKVIEEVKLPPPPPERLLPPPPKLEAPPPPFIPPPEVQIATPPPTQNVISSTTSTPPPSTDIRPMAPPVQAAPPAPPRPAQVSASVVCSNFVTAMGDAAFPREARRAGLEKGEVLVQFTLAANGEIKDMKAVRATHQIFARAAMGIVSEFKCQGQGHDVVVQVPFSYKLE
jgi:periplasmic protein TonB